MGLEIVPLVTRWEALPGIGRDPAVSYGLGDMVVGGVELNTLHSSVKVLPRTKSEFRIAIVGGEEERRDIEYSEQKRLGEVAKVGPSKGDWA